jgi:hypothetical protein
MKKSMIQFNEKNAWKRRREIARIFRRFGLEFTIDLQPEDEREAYLKKELNRKYDRHSEAIIKMPGYDRLDEYLKRLVSRQVYAIYHGIYITKLQKYYAKLRKEQERHAKPGSATPLT